MIEQQMATLLVSDSNFGQCGTINYIHKRSRDNIFGDSQCSSNSSVMCSMRLDLGVSREEDQ